MGCTNSSVLEPPRSAVYADPRQNPKPLPTAQVPPRAVESRGIVLTEEEVAFLRQDEVRRQQEDQRVALPPLNDALRGASEDFGLHPTLPLYWYCLTRPGSDIDVPQKENQDAFIVHGQIGKDSQSFSVGVFDGHGPNGKFSSNFVAKEMVKQWQRYKLDAVPATEEITVGRILHNSCLKVNNDLSLSKVDVYLSGSTAIMALFKDNFLYTTNVGDSRAVLARSNPQFPSGYEALNLSRDHKPDSPDEEDRIVAAGGRVFCWGVPRVWKKDADIPGLAMTRSFGDEAAESVGVFAQPEITVTHIDEGDEFVILASDGIWEFITSQDAVETVAKHLHKPPGIFAKQACHELLQQSLAKWNAQEDSVDDCTCCIIRLNV